MSGLITIPAEAEGRRSPKKPDWSSLEAVAERLLAEADEQVLAIRHAAESECAEILAAARAEASRALALARNEGEVNARRAGEQILAVARSDARSRVLAARRNVYDTLRRSAVEEVRQRASGGRCAVLEEQIRTTLEARLGAGAAIEGGLSATTGIVAHVGRRRAAIDAATLVDASIRAMAARIEAVWR